MNLVAILGIIFLIVSMGLAAVVLYAAFVAGKRANDQMHDLRHDTRGNND